MFQSTSPMLVFYLVFKDKFIQRQSVIITFIFQTEIQMNITKQKGKQVFNQFNSLDPHPGLVN